MKTKNLFLKGLQYWPALVLLLVFFAVTSCEDQARGFVLPEGDIAEGKLSFTKLNCDNCHTIADLPWTGNAELGDPNIQLGGSVSSIKTYGELVTSVINPSHKVSKSHQKEQEVLMGDGTSKMERYNYNYVMTVQELVDVVTFLQSEYEVTVPKNHYPYYGN